jgi:branched-chain amino acid aminotransferase
MPLFVHLNGVLVSAELARISPFDHGFLYGDGVYETLRTFRGKVFDSASHLHRLRESANFLDIPVPWKNIEIESWIQETVRKNNFSESRIRISLTRGENNFEFLGSQHPTLLITITPLPKYPISVYTQGITLVTNYCHRTLPEIKTISLLPMILGKQKAKKEKAFDCLFLDEKGYITECSTSNILFRKKNTLFITPKEKVLSGTMQRIFLEKVKQKGYNIKEQYSTLIDVQSADEVIITNSLFGSLPVQKISTKNILECPGEVFQKCHIDFTKDMFFDS